MGAASAVAKKQNKSDPKPPKKVLVAFKCSEEFKEWLVRVAEHERLTPSSLIEHALVGYASGKGLEPAPKR